MIKKSILIWLAIIPLAILNGTLRQYLIAPLVGQTYAYPISGLMLSGLIFTVAFLFIPRLGTGKPSTYWLMGIAWVMLTITFETAMGISQGHNLNQILKNYDITTGNLWLLILIFTGFVPWLAAKARHLI